MKDETQAVHLAKIMQKQNLYPEYELILPPVQIKKSKLKKITKEDVILLGLERLELNLLSEGNICATVSVIKEKNSKKIKITSLNHSVNTTDQHKKYEILKCSFGFLQSRVVEVGHKIDISSLNLNKVSLSINDKVLAKGSLVNVDDEIAIQIEKVEI